MPALSDSQKAEILSRADSGEDPKEIARTMGVNHLGVYGTIKQDRVRKGLEDAPAKKKVRVHQEQEFEVPADARVGVIPSAPPAEVSFNGSPLFPKRSEAEIDRVTVDRKVARPASAGTGLICEIDPEATEADIKEAWGGGRYEVRAFSSSGRMLGQRVIKIAGLSIPVDAEEEVEDAPPMEVPRVADSEMAVKFAEKIMHRQEQMMQMQIEQARIAADSQVKWLMQAQAQRQSESEANSRMMLEIMSRNQPKRSESLLDDLEKLAVLKDFFGGGGEPEVNPVAVAIQNLPNILKQGAYLLHGPEEYEEEEEEETTTQPVPPQQAQQQQVQQPAQPQPPTYDRIAQALYARLIADGVPEEEAVETVKFGLNTLAARVPKKKKAKNGVKPQPVPQTQPTSEGDPIEA